MFVFNTYFCKNRKSKLHFGDRVAVLNGFLYQTGGSRNSNVFSTFSQTHHIKYVKRHKFEVLIIGKKVTNYTILMYFATRMTLSINIKCDTQENCS
jgi:hypothetical protein